MADADFIEAINRDYFDGGLSPGFLEGLTALPTNRPDVRAFIERMVRFVRRADIQGRDLSALQGVVLGSLLARLLPGAWEGRVPPITVKNRHVKIDDFILDNRYLEAGRAGSMLDLGCGFPPETTVGSADKLEGWTIRGSDPSMPAWMIYDAEGTYAAFDAGGAMLYCQPSAPTVENWNALLQNLDATTQRFRRLAEAMGGPSRGSSTAPDGSRLIVDPKQAFERPGLTFGVGGIGEIDAANHDVVRCLNVLFYFDDAFCERALAWFHTTLSEGGILLIGADWAMTTECRCLVYQRVDRRLEPREFLFSLDNVAPLGVVSFFALHDDDRTQSLLARLVRRLRQHAPFLRRYYEVTDALRAKYGICPRGPDGFYGSIDATMSPDQLWQGAAAMSDTVAGELGVDAVSVLERAGWNARFDRHGFVSVSLDSVPAEGT
jgi:hypothetical protein